MSQFRLLGTARDSLFAVWDFHSNAQQLAMNNWTKGCALTGGNRGIVGQLDGLIKILFLFCDNVTVLLRLNSLRSISPSLIGRIDMSIMAALSVLLLAQASPGATAEQATDTTNAAFEEISAGENREAIAMLEMALTDNPDDPALLINLGSAYAELGEYEQAAQYYRAAAESDVRYRLELADGEWVDSRRAARVALLRLEERALAMR